MSFGLLVENEQMQFWTVGLVRRSMCLSPHLLPYSVLRCATDQEVPLGGVRVHDCPKYQPVLGATTQPHTHTHTDGHGDQMEEIAGDACPHTRLARNLLVEMRWG